ncbi:hypothetical protein [Hyphococcus sp.]|uniref:hypothetical protein n=1 Tax=Hyphococcus sp. TaxID=2038636 RepID=UPI0035C74447
MYSGRLIQYLRTFLVIVMAAAFMIAPVSEAADTLHPGGVNADICLGTDASEQGPQDSSPGNHEHTTHQCGSCHIHVMNSSDDCTAGTSPASGKQVLPDNPAYATLGFDGVYRPPRA